MDETRTAAERARLLRNLKAMRGDELTVAGLLFFGRRPQDYLPTARVDFARFAGPSAGEMILDRKELTGLGLRRSPLPPKPSFMTIRACPEPCPLGLSPSTYPRLPKSAPPAPQSWGEYAPRPPNPGGSHQTNREFPPELGG